MENKTTTLNKKLKSYSALAGTLIAVGSSADAQVVYTDVIPDATLTPGQFYDIDLDNNTVVDFRVGVVHGSSSGITYDFAYISLGAGNAIDTVMTTGGPVVHPISTAINSSLLWRDDAAASYGLLGVSFPAYAYATGNFIGQTNKYVGLRFKIGAVDHYGWVRIDLNATSNSAVVKDYAYDATAGASILTGATSTAINESADLAGMVQIFSASKNIHVNMNNAAVTGNITVTDVLGKEVANTAITSTNNVISMENANTGIYFVSVNQENARFTQKVIIK